ncbi:MarR family transcriptional regulator [Phocaeicola sp. HCN-6420]|uniref:MarR family transcriptional regulator n=1 Tax=Phocaeicola sp. HCN-6420 TaxID=3134673 RepID=UPI0030C2BB6B
MESYITLTKDIHKIKGNNKLETILAIAGIKSTGNYKTNIAETTREYIAAKTRISFRTVKSIVPRLIENADFIFDKIETRIKSPNRYYFKKDGENYFFVLNSFFNETIDTKIKGLLLLIKSVCKQETNKYISEKPYKGALNHSELASKLGIDVKTLDKYLEKAIKEGQIKMIPKGLLILNKSIIPDFKSNDQLSRLYHIIYDWCLDNDVIPPDRNDEITQSSNGQTKRNNPVLNAILCKTANMSDEEIRSLLNKRIVSKDVTLKYIAKALNVNMHKTETKPLNIVIE